MGFVRRLIRRHPDGEPWPAGPSSVLELRVHGVNNTPPPALLDLAPADIEQVAGDALGSFWRPTAAARARLRPQDRGHVPDGVVREAYSWGGLARTSPAVGSGVVGLATGALARIGWALLLPFGLVNVAFWSRRLDGERGYSRGWQDGATAAAVRLYALCLTLLVLGSAAVVSLDLVATQCFAGSQRWCTRLPAALDGLAAMSHGQRLAIASVVPLALLGLLAGLSAVARTRYEQLAAMPSAEPGTVSAGTPVLATPGLWSNARLTSTVGRMHVAAGLCFLVLATSWHQVFGTGPACASMGQVLGSRSAACRDQVFPLEPSTVPFAITLVLALFGLVGVAVALAVRSWGAAATPGSPSGRRVARRVTWVLLACGALFATHTVLLATVSHETAVEVPLLGLVGTPVLLTAVLLGIAVSGLWWRGTRDRHEAWGGRAPAVFLLLALGVQLILSSLLVVSVADWLNGSRSAGELLRGGIGLPGSVPAPSRDGCEQVCPVPDPQLTIPSVYIWFGVATLVALGVVVVLGVVAALRTSRTLQGAGAVPEQMRRRHRRGGTLDELSARPGAAELVHRARRAAAAAHRAEPLTGVLAVACGVCTTLAVAVAVVISLRPSLGPPQLRRITPGSWAEVAYAALADAGAWAVGLVGLLVVAGLVGGAAVGRKRPLGLVWDLICFLPRTGHPFGPPCYAERVVPELVRRYAEWVDPADDGADGGAVGRRRVVISAHSLGAVLVVASLFATLVEHGSRVTDRLSVLSYGTQLRAYFGRMFPELLGPAVLGTTPGLAAGLFTRDPWQDAVAHDAAVQAGQGDRPAEPAGPAEPADQRTLVGLLTEPEGKLRWVNLWRRTDYLGFPADRYVGGIADQPAEEIDTSGYLPEVGTHGGYYRTLSYAAAFAALRQV